MTNIPSCSRKPLHKLLWFHMTILLPKNLIAVFHFQYTVRRLKMTCLNICLKITSQPLGLYLTQRMQWMSTSNCSLCPLMSWYVWNTTMRHLYNLFYMPVLLWVSFDITHSWPYMLPLAPNQNQSDPSTNILHSGRILSIVGFTLKFVKELMIQSFFLFSPLVHV